ncbi:MAG: phosphoribosyltransferase family protein [Candidatus Omnitrophota bacterium]
MSFAKVARSCVNILFPEQCIACGTLPAAYPLPVCSRCSDSVIRAAAPALGSSKNLTKILSCRYYEGAIKKCVKQFKYSGKLKLMDLFQPVVHTFINRTHPFSEQIHGAIPVPVHPSKRRARGYNQSELIATILSQEISVPVQRHTLIKTKNTGPQTALARNKRMRNLDGSFAVVDRTLVTGRNLVLVDDIVTTGATLETCARELLKAGARCVYGFTLAKTP